jgi:hypothetical protein
VKAPGEWPERIGSLLIEIHGTEGSVRQESTR